MKKAEKYRKNFRHIGVAIIIDIPLFFFEDKEWGKWFTNINDRNYDFVAIIHMFGVEIYDFFAKEYFRSEICREDMDALKKLGRMAAEGIVKDDDSVWK